MTAPVVGRENTSPQMPVLRPRMVGIQSQPMEAWYVGLSAPGRRRSCRVLVGLLLAAPGVAFFSTRTASAFVRPACSFAGDVEAAAHEAAIDASQLLAIEEDSAFQLMPSKLSHASCPRAARGLELCAIPEVGIEEGVGDVELVLPEVRVGDRADVQIRGKDGAGHGARTQSASANPASKALSSRPARFARCTRHDPPARSVASPWPVRERLGFGDEAAVPENFEFAQDVACRTCGRVISTRT